MGWFQWGILALLGIIVFQLEVLIWNGKITMKLIAALAKQFDHGEN